MNKKTIRNTVIISAIIFWFALTIENPYLAMEDQGKFLYWAIIILAVIGALKLIDKYLKQNK